MGEIPNVAGVNTVEAVNQAFNGDAERKEEAFTADRQAEEEYIS